MGKALSFPQEDSDTKRSRMPFVSLSGVNQGFWPHLGFSRRNATTLTLQNIFKDALKEILMKKRCLSTFD